MWSRPFSLVLVIGSEARDDQKIMTGFIHDQSCDQAIEEDAAECQSDCGKW